MAVESGLEYHRAVIAASSDVVGDLGSDPSGSPGHTLRSWFGETSA
ncbi:MAG: hypothetical protein ACKV22_05125 [Bryobacteraceae bacterium]